MNPQTYGSKLSSDLQASASTALSAVNQAGQSAAERTTDPPGGILGAMARWPKLTLCLLTLASLLPFSGKAIHIDDPLFLWTAQHITQHPLDPYGFTAFWWNRPTPMWHVQQNPPLAAYYLAVIGSIAGWSERALHLGFLLPAMVVVLGTYRLARRFTRRAFLAAAATLAAPGFLISATTLMCDVSMLALWMLALVFWIEGLDEPVKPIYLALSSFLIGTCALTKYFGVSLIPLLFVYSWFRQRSLRRWIAYLAIPLLMLGGYELYTAHLYGHGHIAEAASYQSTVRQQEGRSGRALVGLAFLGGCALPALTFIPFLWSRRQILWLATASGLLALFFWSGWIDLGSVYQYETWLHANRPWIAMQLFFYVAGGLSILALTIVDYWEKRDTVSLVLILWIFGTLLFALVLNWTVNARSLLPMVPAAAILIARRLDALNKATTTWHCALVIPLVISGAISLWVAAADMAIANTARTAANYIHEKTRDDFSRPWFQGRWGFEYYMESFGARPLEPEAQDCKFGDLVIIPKYNTSLFKFPLKTTKAEIVDFEVHTWAATMNPDAGAGFYFSGWGPLPFVFGPVPAQRYLMARVLQAP